MRRLKGRQMAKKLKAKPMYPEYPEYTEVTPENKAVIDSIGNPFIVQYLVSGFSLIVGIYLFFTGRSLPYGPVQIYFNIFGMFFIIFGAAFCALNLNKNIKFNKFIKKDKHRIIWVYEDGRFEQFYVGLKTQNPGVNKSRLWLLAGLVTILTWFLYATLSVEVRWTAVPFGLLCLVFLMMTSFLIPRYYLTSAKKKPYISIIDDDEAYACGRYHHWNKGFVRYKALPDIYGPETMEMLMTYQSRGVIGKSTPTFHVFIPSNDSWTLNFARREGKRINKQRKELNNNPQREDDFMDKAFKKMMGREDNTGM